MAKTKYNKQEAIDLRNKGLTFKQIAEVMGSSEIWVSKTLKGIPKGFDSVPVDATRLKAIALAEEFLKKIKAL